MKISENHFQGTDCLKDGVPWHTPEAIIAQDKFLTKHDYVLEIGGGGSTIFYAKRCAKVTCIETNIEWFVEVQNRIKEEGLDNVMMIYAATEAEILHAIAALKPVSNVLLVDPQGGFNRSIILAQAIDCLCDQLEIIILDNYSHPVLFPPNRFVESYLEFWVSKTFDLDRWAGSGTKIYRTKPEI